MSEIDIEKKESGGIPWWAYLLGALVLGALIFYATAAMSGNPKVATAVADNGAMVADADTDGGAMDTNTLDGSMSNTAEDGSTVPVAPSADTPEVSAVTESGAAITNLLSIVDAKDPASLYNKEVKVLGAPVQAAGTKVFWVGPSFEQKMLVVTDGSTEMNGINTGVAQRDRVDLEGTIMEITDFDDAKTKYDLDDTAVTFLTNKKVLLMAKSVKRDQN